MSLFPRRLRAGLLALALACVALLAHGGCSRGPDLTPRTGYVQTTGGKLWYRIAGTGHGTPLLLLHGGPGASSYYLKPLADLGDDRPVIFYDQLGSGRSDPSPDSALWTVEHYVGEIDDVRRALGLKEVHLYGHSWGTILAAEYMLRKPTGVRSVTFSSPVLSVPKYVHASDSLRAMLPDSCQRAIALREADGNTAAPDYQNALQQFYAQFVARKQPWSADVDSTFASLNQKIYEFLQGPSEFTITGTLKDYDVTQRLHEIATPALFLVGRYDEVTPDLTIFYARQIAGATTVAIPDAGHLTMQDNAPRHNAALREFLRNVDAMKR